MIFIWIFISNLLFILELKEVSAKCVSPLPENINPACRGAKLANISTAKDCQSFNSSCCWDDSVGDQYSKCYYVPDKKVYNAALGKPTNQSTIALLRGSLLAVDGCTTCCSQTLTYNNSWWFVDLLKPMPILSVSIVAQENTDLLFELEIRASNSTDDPQTLTDFVTCAPYPQSVKQGGTKRIQCAQNTIARVLIIIKTTTTSRKSFSLCEVQVETAGRFNAAFGKATWQSTVLDYKGFDNRGLKNVDGWLNNNYSEGYCSHTKSYEDYDPWWSVDLGRQLTIYSVTIVNGGDADRRLQNLTVTVSGDSHEPATEVCAEYPGKIIMGATQYIACNKPMEARYVIVQKLGDHELVMCEVIVETACVDGKYGANCWYSCHNCKDNATCDKVTGYCPGGLCSKGYNGKKCDIGCVDTFGYNCANTCHCKDGVFCHSESGICSDEMCDLGFKGINCNTACDDGKYGANCSNTCYNCRHNATCDKVTGHCPGELCANGYNGQRCDNECVDTFGYNCVHPCHCKDGVSCDSLSGSCPDGMCDFSFKGLKCSAACGNNEYGMNCGHTCHCKDNASCDKKSGICPNMECDRGYSGDQCDQVCVNTFGYNCTYPCHCEDAAPCDHVNGSCPDNQCDYGYKGNNCSIECPANTYDYKCANNCSIHCREKTCNNTNGYCDCIEGYMRITSCMPGKYGINCKHNCSGNCMNDTVCSITDGSCGHNACKSGYIGTKCEKECLPGKFGENCAESCERKCIKEECNRFNGHCNRCEIGYRGNRCDQTCSFGHYGLDCSEECSGNCFNNVTCNHINGTCERCAEGYEMSTCHKEIKAIGTPNNPGSVDSQPKIGVIAGPVVCVVVVVVLVLFVLVFIFIRKREPNGNKYPDTSSDGTFIRPDLHDSQNNCNSATVDIQPSITAIKTTKLGEYVDNMKDNDAYKDEYESIPKSIFPMDHAGVAELKIKNRYNNIYPYDNNRVLLKKIGDDWLSDYINASFIKDYNGKKSYIAALGTTDKTIDDFWRMIWENNVQIIVMVTNLFENQKMKCVQYWPGDILTTSDEIKVEFKVAKSTRHCIIRSFQVQKEDTVRYVKQYHYTDWPDKLVPENISGLHKIIQFMKQHRANQQTPILVHCSAGVGRTGTIIALDILLDQAVSEGVVDVYSCVHRLREQRTHMVQTLVQYEFIHNYLREILTVGLTAVLCSELKNVLEQGNIGKLEEQYQLLNKTIPSFPEMDLEFGTNENKNKNRDNSVVPSDLHRAKLASSPEIYINAVFLEGFKRQMAFCATQVPLENTVEEFWKFMFEHSCKAMVCLQTDPTHTQWLPKEEQSIVCGLHNIYTDKVTTIDGITQCDVTIQKLDGLGCANIAVINTNPEMESCKLRVFVLDKCSNTNMKDRDPKALIDLYSAVQKWQQQAKNCMVTVMCLNGCDETGLYIALSQLLNMACTEKEVDVYHIVKKLRQKRPQFITSVEQYTFLHTAVQQYIAEFAPDCVM